MPKIEINPGPPEVSPGPPNGPLGTELPAVQSNPGPPDSPMPMPPPGPKSPPAAKRGFDFSRMNIEDLISYVMMLIAGDSRKDLKDMMSDLDSLRKEKQAIRDKLKKQIALGAFLVIALLALVGTIAVVNGAFQPGGPAGKPGDTTTEAPVATEALSGIPALLQGTEQAGGGVCGSACPADGQCAGGLTCSAGQANIQGATACLRNGHCGCGVPCDPAAANACDPGLKCVAQGAASVCWAGGCEPTPTPACLLIPGDGVCNPACETAQNDPADCSPDTGDGGGNKGGGGKVCACTCSTGGISVVCKDCKGKKCAP